jgi:L-fuconolactonase
MDEPNPGGTKLRDQWVDSHHHLWHYSKSEYPWMTERMQALRRDFNIDDLAAASEGFGLVGTVAVQARQSVEETEWLLELATISPLVKGVVGWAPLLDANLRHWLDRWQGRKELKGIRHLLHDEQDEHYMLRADFNAGIRLLRQYQLTYDLLIFERHLPQTIRFVDQHPDQTFVLDHIGKPRIREGGLEPWKTNILHLAERPNVCCKLSGMVTEADWSMWSLDQLRPYFEHVLAAFGPSRLMFGSDWPVLTLAADYAKWLKTVEAWLSTLSEPEAGAIRYGNAIRVYQLQIGT